MNLQALLRCAKSGRALSPSIVPETLAATGQAALSPMSNPPTEACSLKQAHLVTLGECRSIGTTLLGMQLAARALALHAWRTVFSTQAFDCRRAFFRHFGQLSQPLAMHSTKTISALSGYKARSRAGIHGLRGGHGLLRLVRMPRSGNRNIAKASTTSEWHARYSNLRRNSTS